MDPPHPPHPMREGLGRVEGWAKWDGSRTEGWAEWDRSKGPARWWHTDVKPNPGHPRTNPIVGNG